MGNVYSIKSLSSDIVDKSSSGGAIPELIKYIFNNKGLVYGAVYDDNYKGVHHTYTENLNDYFKYFSGSKYIRSNIGGVFVQVKKHLDEERLICFIGTPCQVYYLKKYLKKDYDKLYTIDLLCNSVIDPKLYNIWINDLESKYGSKVNYINMVDKSRGWRNRSINIRFNNGAFYKRLHTDDTLLKCFLSHEITWKKCSECEKYIKHVSDITVGDHWNNSDKNSTGINMISVNTNKGRILFNNAVNLLKINLQFSEITNNSYCGNRLLYDKIVHIFTFLKNQFNFGQKLQAYAIQKLVSGFGYYPVTYYDELVSNVSKKSNDLINNFCINYMNIASYKNYRANKNDIHIVGSDQIWQQDYIANNYNRYLFKNVDSTNKLGISVSISSNSSRFVSVLKSHKTTIDKFKYLGMRELAGVNVLKSIGVNSELFIDPTLLLTESEWESIENKPDFIKNNLDYTLIYLVHGDKLPVFKEKNIYNINTLIHREGIGPREFIWLVHHCTKLYTNSFHGACFATIFKKNFELVDKSLWIKDDRFITLKYIIDNNILNNRQTYVNKLKEVLDGCN